MHDFCRARFLSRTIFVVHESCTIVHDNRFGQAQNRARSHDKIFVVILNPDLVPIIKIIAIISDPTLYQKDLTRTAEMKE